MELFNVLGWRDTGEDTGGVPSSKVNSPNTATLEVVRNVYLATF